MTEQQKIHQQARPPLTIANIPGDGIGKEVLPEGLRVLEKVASRFAIDFEFSNHDWNCETYARTGRMMPEDGIE